jgi:hypothetical protein
MRTTVMSVVWRTNVNQIILRSRKFLMSTQGADAATTKAKKAQARRERRHAEKNGQPLPAKKRGNPGNFGGARLRFLEAATDDYSAASSRGRGHIQPFLATFMASWWKTFPWYTDLDPDDVLGSLTKVNLGMIETTQDSLAAGAAAGDASSTSAAGSPTEDASAAGAASADSGEASGAGAAGPESGDTLDTVGAGPEQVSGASDDAESRAHGIAAEWRGKVENIVSMVSFSVASLEGKHD